MGSSREVNANYPTKNPNIEFYILRENDSLSIGDQSGSVSLNSELSNINFSIILYRRNNPIILVTNDLKMGL